ncbi:hypothetical protein [Chelativorans sp. Marseille-P2723]|uniref:hypothetical protein n=1 Tax=Chelativorans sp. Marseille-P2723 TaxID=2709133 RepID=UPI0015702BE0|nr:hypothetical protein [Chelativorans sp. Marseille-P2723]
MPADLDFRPVYQDTVESCDPTWGERATGAVREKLRLAGMICESFVDTARHVGSQWQVSIPQTFTSTKEFLGNKYYQYTDANKRPYAIADEKRILYNIAFDSLKDLDPILVNSGDQTNVPHAELEGLNSSLPAVKDTFHDFVQLRKKEKDDPGKALLALLVSPSRDTYQSEIIKQYVYPTLLSVIATGASQYLWSQLMASAFDTLPQGMKDAIIEEVLGKDAIGDEHALSKAIGEVPERFIDGLDGSIDKKLAEEVLSLSGLSAEGRKCIERVIAAIDSISHPSSTFLNEVNATPAESYGVQGTVAAVGQPAGTYFTRNISQLKGAAGLVAKGAATWAVTLIAGSLAHLLTRLAHGKGEAFGREFVLNSTFSLINSIGEPFIQEGLRRCCKNHETAEKISRVLILASLRWLLKCVKMTVALHWNGASVDSLGGGWAAVVRNAGSTAVPTVLKAIGQEGLDRWYDYSKTNSGDYRFSSQVAKTAEAVDGLIGALQLKLSQNDLQPEQEEAFKRALAILDDCKRVKEWTDNWNPDPQAISTEDLYQARDRGVEQYAERAKSSALAAYSIEQ